MTDLGQGQSAKAEPGTTRPRRIKNRLVRVMLVTAVTLAAALPVSFLLQVACNPIALLFGSTGPCLVWLPHPPQAIASLIESSPQVENFSRKGGGYKRYTAAYMNRAHPERYSPGPQLRFVPANVASTGPTVVSVNPISRRLWGAAALSAYNGRCYVQLISDEASHNELSAVLPPGARCVAAAVSASTVTGEAGWPYLPKVQPLWIAEGVVFLMAGLALAGSNAFRDKFAASGCALWGFGVILIAMGYLSVAQGLGTAYE